VQDFALSALKKDTFLSMDTKATLKNGPTTIEVVASQPKVRGALRRPPGGRLAGRAAE